MSDDRAARIARAQSLLGVFPLAAFVVLHLVQVSSALDGRVAWVVTHVDAAPSFALGVGLLLALLLHAGLGVWRWRARLAAGGEPGDGGLARVQRVTGVLAAAFIAYHVWHVWPEPPGPHVDPGRSYDRLQDTLGAWPQLLAYVLGITALCFHLGHGLSRVPFSWGVEPTRGRMMRARLAGGLLGLVLWLAALHVVGYFATGDGLWPRGGGAAPAPAR